MRRIVEVDLARDVPQHLRKFGEQRARLRLAVRLAAPKKCTSARHVAASSTSGASQRRRSAAGAAATSTARASHRRRRPPQRSPTPRTRRARARSAEPPRPPSAWMNELEHRRANDVAALELERVVPRFR